MGENSKRIGETGEEVVANFLKLIGWNDPQRNIDITSMDTEHRKYSNGLDGYFHYASPMISNTVENIIFCQRTDRKTNFGLKNLRIE